jgi:hypothetical protein
MYILLCVGWGTWSFSEAQYLEEAEPDVPLLGLPACSSSSKLVFGHLLPSVCTLLPRFLRTLLKNILGPG